MINEIAIKIGGLLSVMLGIGHCFFYRRFSWKKDFEKIRFVTAKVLYTIHLFLIPIFFFFGYVSWAYTKELAGGTSLGIALTTFYSFFWFIRLLWQIIYFRSSKIVGFEKLLLLHYFLIFYFIILWMAYILPLLNYYFD